MYSKFRAFKPGALELRQQGLSYSQIKQKLGVDIPQSTLSNWCSAISLAPAAQEKLRKRMSGHPYRTAVVSMLAKKRREDRRELVYAENQHLNEILKNSEVSKIALAMLYLGEGAKTERDGVKFGNSNPNIIRLFLDLFHKSYSLDISKFRIRIQCRADQDFKSLEKFWRSVVNIPGVRFYPTWSDKRTIGKPTKRKEYMGVCCISYLDTKIQFELVNVGNLLCSVGGR